MLRSILNSFARAYGRGLGYSAARKTSWLAIPILIVIVVFGVAELDKVQMVWQSIGRLIPDWGL